MILTYDGDILVLQGWVNRQGIIPPSGQDALRATIGRVLDKLSHTQAEVEQLRDSARIALDIYKAGKTVLVQGGIRSQSFNSNAEQFAAAWRDLRSAVEAVEAAEEGG